MKENTHPKYYTDAVVTCACGNSWTTGSTLKSIRTDVCFKCHPFYTGEQRIVDSEGQVDRFYRKLEARKQHLAGVAAREAARTSPERPIEELELGKRANEALAKSGILNVGQLLEKMDSGDAAVLSIEGFGRKSLADAKKRLRAFGYELAETTENVAA